MQLVQSLLWESIYGSEKDYSEKYKMWVMKLNDNELKQEKYAHVMP